MTATALAHDFSHDFATDPNLNFPGDHAMDRWFGDQIPTNDTGRPQLQVIEGAGRVDVPAAGFDPTVEMYRRRRFAVALALTAIILLVAQLAGLSLTSFGPSTPSAADEPAAVVHVVRPGDTYAGIAAELGAEHPQSFAAELRLANGDAELVVGNRIVVERASLG